MVVLPTLQKIGAAQCPGCNNVGHVVVMRRIVIGNNSLFQTNYGSPTSSLIDATTGYVKNYSSDASDRADGFANLLTLNNWGDCVHGAELLYGAGSGRSGTV